MKKIYLLILLLLVAPIAWATHIVGGEFELRHTGQGYQYELYLNLYFDDIYGNQRAEDRTVTAAVYSKGTNRLIEIFELVRLSSTHVEYTNPACTVAQLETRLIRYGKAITLSREKYSDPAGYYVVWERCCRNNHITNIIAPQDAGMAFYLEFPAVTKQGRISVNNSPVFSIPKGDFACVDEPFTFDFGATDPDGDELKYSLVTPYNGNSTVRIPNPHQPSEGNGIYIPASFTPGPYSPVRWASEKGISLNNVIPGKQPLRVNPTTGQLSFTANKEGLYVFSVLCEEFRAGQKIGEVRRDFQLLVVPCPKTVAPNIKLKEPGKNTFYQEGQVIKVAYQEEKHCFTFAIADSSLIERVNLQINPLNFPADWVSLSPTSGSLNGIKDTLYAELCWSKCAQSKPGEPLVFNIVASDKSCPLPKRDTLQVKVEFEPIPNNPPVVSTSLLNNSAFVIAGDSLQFTVTGKDSLDNDNIALEAIGRGFNLAEKGMSFTNSTATGSITIPFTWKPDCAKAADGETFIVDFIVKDIHECPGLQKTDTVTVSLQFKARDTRTPEVTTTLPNNQEKLEIGKPIIFNVIGTDPDNDLITLRAVGRGFNLEDVGMQFRNNQTGRGRIEEPFSWIPTCENTERDRGRYIIDFIVEDNSCASNGGDTVTVELDLSDFEVVFTGFNPPNVFTPNGDGVNDYYEIPDELLPPDNCKDHFEDIEIYNRWGKLVYKGDNRAFRWDGEGFPTGVYFYLIHYKNSQYKGTVSLLK